MNEIQIFKFTYLNIKTNIMILYLVFIQYLLNKINNTLVFYLIYEKKNYIFL